MREVLKETYARQQTLEQAKEQFIERLSTFYGGITLKASESLSNDEEQLVEKIVFLNGYQLILTLVREGKSFEIKAKASLVFNSDYISKITEDEWFYLLELVEQSSLELTEEHAIKQTMFYEMKDIEERWEYLERLVISRNLSLTEIPGLPHTQLTEAERAEAQRSNYLLPKMMIITGRATEDNFHYE